MDRDILDLERRRFFGKVGTLALGAAAFTSRGLFADELARTPAQTEGPFYPDRLPLDTDNDLVILSNDLTPAAGQVTHLTGRILDARGEPVKNALVEIWQVDANAIYIHTQCPGQEKKDKHFQGYGKFLTDSKGEYRFRTIKPVPYPGRTPHIHYKISKGNKALLTTQCYVKGEAQNEKDGVFRSIPAGKARESVLVAFDPMPKSKAGELVARWDVVLGVTPAE